MTASPQSVLRSPAYWITTAVAVIALFPAGWNYFVPRPRLTFTPIAADIESETLVVEFALANTGNRPAILAELCMRPRLWPARDSAAPQQIIPLERIPFVEGVAWRPSVAGARHSAIATRAGDLFTAEAFFSLRGEWVNVADRPDNVELEFHAFVVDHEGATRRAQLSTWLTLSGPTRLSFSETEPTQLYPGTPTDPGQTYGASFRSYPYCRFTPARFGP